jgi:hypothetical protein
MPFSNFSGGVLENFGGVRTPLHPPRKSAPAYFIFEYKIECLIFTTLWLNYFYSILYCFAIVHLALLMGMHASMVFEAVKVLSILYLHACRYIHLLPCMQVCLCGSFLLEPEKKVLWMCRYSLYSTIHCMFLSISDCKTTWKAWKANTRGTFSRGPRQGQEKRRYCKDTDTETFI